MSSFDVGSRTATLAPELDQPSLTENARKVLEARYLKKNEAGECIEKPGELFRRVARTIAAVEDQYGGSEAERRRWEDRFYKLMTSGDFMPNSPTLMNAGREMGMLSACFVLPVRDSIDAIFDSIKHTALIQKAGGGTGFAFDELRPTGDYISSSGGTTSGPISFWRAFSEATNAIQQGAFRRGANMGMMYVHHPDILKFLHAKQDLTQFTNYNISVKMTDVWMDEFLADPDSPHVVRNPRSGVCFLLPRDLEIWKYDVRSLIETNQVEAINSRDPRASYYTSPRFIGTLPEALRGKVYTKRDIWSFIIKNAWQTGEPGVVFMDRINEANPTPHIGRMEATNPCGEQPLLPYEACNLGSINLGNFIRNECTPGADVDWDALRECVHASTRYLDNVIDANNYPLPEIDAVCKNNRKIGLGIMGFADALYKLNIAYNSDDGVAWGERFMKFINDEAHNYSEHLAKLRGCFPNWKGSHWDTKYRRLMRNSCSTTVAPTGTISIISNCSGGIEPMFSLAFIRNVLRGQKQGEKPLVEVNDTFKKVAAAHGFLSDALLERIATEGTLAHIDEIPDNIKRVFVCAHDIAPVWHMRMQAAFQRHNDSSISKTINFPESATDAEVEEIYRLAYQLRCKGVTVYRDGCRNFQPMALKDSGKKHEEGTKALSHEGAKAVESVVQPPSAAADSVKVLASVAHADAPANGNGNGNGNGSGNGGAHPEKCGAGVSPVISNTGVTPVPQIVPAPRLEPTDLPEIVSGLRIRQLTPFGNMHVKISVDPRSGVEREVFAQLGRGGDVATSDLEAICRMISLWLRSGGSLRHVIKQLEGIGSSLQIPTKAGRIMSLGDGLACALKKYSRAKERFGLRPLLLGDVDLAELDNPSPPKSTVIDHAPPAGAEGTKARRHEGTQGSGAGDSASAFNVPRSTLSSPAATFETRMTDAATIVTRTDAPRTGMGGQPTSGAVGMGSMGQPPSAAIPSRAVPSPDNSATLVAQLEQAVALLDVADPLETGHAELAMEQAIFEAATAVATETIVEERISLSTEHRTLSTTVRKHFHDSAEHFALKCPECAGTLALQEGCRKCHACGWSAC